MTEAQRKYQETCLNILWYGKTSYEECMAELKPLTDDASERVKNQLAQDIVTTAKLILKIKNELELDDLGAKYNEL